MSFTTDIRAFAKKANANMDMVVRRATFELCSMLVLKTAVDTGLLRSNWQVGQDTPPEGTIGMDVSVRHEDRVKVSRIKGGAVKAHRVATGGTVNRVFDQTQTLSAGHVAWIVNNLPYALSIMEYGHSKQTPPAAARTSVMEIQSRLNSLVRGLA